ncbi:MAG: hypothetical protein KC931_20180, partial [Candidatus Omnitrophica bacterium]|nr:hypothetical protein [Candidatus Omnitrophota bacterium]
FDRWGGLIAAAYLAIHPVLLQYSKEARGFTLGIFFLTCGSLALWKTLEKPRLIPWVGSLVAFYLAYLFHPTMALAFPGVLAATVIVAGRFLYFGKWDWRRFVRDPKSIGAIGIAVVVGGVLAFPYLRSYLDWGSLLIPEHTQSGDSGSLPPPFRSWGSFLFYSAPLLISPRHWGAPLHFALALAVCGMGGLRRRFNQALFITLPAVAPIPFFWIVPFEKIPERYMLGCLPFVCLLVALGIRNISDFLANRLRRPRLRPVAALALTLLLMALCLRPYLAETFYGRKPGQNFYRPFLELVTRKPFEDWKVAFDSPGSFYEIHLRTLGLSDEKIFDGDLGEIDSLPATSGVWVCPTDPKKYVEVDEDLQGRGFVPVDLFGMRVYFYSSGFANEDLKRETVAALLDTAHEELRLDYRTDLSLASLAAQYYLRKREDRLVESGEGKIEDVVFLDPERRAHPAVNARAKWLLSRGKTTEAARTYLAAIAEDPDSVPAFYIELFENIPKTRWPFIANLQDFDSITFANGFLSAIESTVNLTPDRRAELAYRLGNIL